MKKTSTVYLILSILATAIALWSKLNPETVIPNYAVQYTTKADTVRVPETVTIEKERVRYVSGGVTVERYVPPDGKVTIDTALLEQLTAEIQKLQGEVDGNGQRVPSVTAPADSAPKPSPLLAARLDSLRTLLNNPVQSGIVTIHNKGFCLRPMLGAGYDDRFDGFAGAKIAYLNRYGIVIGATTQAVGGGITRRLDFIPFTHNLEGMAFYGYPFKQDGARVYAGIGVGL